MNAGSFFSRVPLSRVPFFRIQLSLGEQQGKEDQKADQDIKDRAPPSRRGRDRLRRVGRGLPGVVPNRVCPGRDDRLGRSFWSLHQHGSLNDLIFSGPLEQEAGFLSCLSRFHQAAGDLDGGYNCAGHLPVRADEPDFIANGYGSFVHPAADHHPSSGDGVNSVGNETEFPPPLHFLSSADDLTQLQYLMGHR
ncbi:MAG: hypothetical protein AMJ94_01510 [Deltaproteobacteria bacterium SM23_61]|nr:MAG: hypothetical protein AMJ94_01510 [Deltaproteobacteria bacterium SM23_61]